MKKLISLMLALVLCLCALTPVMAEEADAAPAEAFLYTQEEYRQLFDVLAANMLQIVPEWTVDGSMAMAALEGYGEVLVEMNDAGQVIRLSTNKVCALNDIQTSANALGMLVALSALGSKATEDMTFMTEENINVYTQELMSLLYSLMDNLGEAMGSTVTVTGEVGGDTATFTMLIDVTTLSITFGFIYEP